MSSLKDDFDYAILAVKSYDTEWCTQLVKPYLKPNGFIMSAQNSINEEAIAHIVGWPKVVGCILLFGAEMYAAGKIRQTSAYNKMLLGEPSGLITSRLEKIKKSLANSGEINTTTNLWGERWSKLTTNASTNPLTAMTGLGAASVAEDSDARYIQIQISKESCQVALAQKYEVEPIKGIEASEWALAEDGLILEKLDEKFLPDNDRGEWKSSMSQDVDKGRRSEILFMNGYIAQQGLSTHVPTPFNTAITKIVREIDEGDRFPDPANVNEVLKMASGLA